MEKEKPKQAAKANVARIWSAPLSGKNSSWVSRATAALEMATMTDTEVRILASGSLSIKFKPLNGEVNRGTAF